VGKLVKEKYLKFFKSLKIKMLIFKIKIKNNLGILTPPPNSPSLKRGAPPNLEAPQYMISREALAPLLRECRASAAAKAGRE